MGNSKKPTDNADKVTTAKHNQLEEKEEKKNTLLDQIKSLLTLSNFLALSGILVATFIALGWFLPWYQQNELKSEVKRDLDGAQRFVNNCEYDKAISLGEKSLTTVIGAGLTDLEVRARSLLSSHYHSLSNYERPKELFDKLDHKLINKAQEQDKWRAFFIKAEIAFFESDYDQAEKLSEKAVKLATNDSQLTASHIQKFSSRMHGNAALDAVKEIEQLRAAVPKKYHYRLSGFESPFLRSVDPERSKKLAEEAMKNSKRNCPQFQFYDLIRNSDSYYHQREYQKAREFLNEAQALSLEQDIYKYKIKYREARLQEKTGNIATAESLYVEASGLVDSGIDWDRYLVFNAISQMQSDQLKSCIASSKKAYTYRRKLDSFSDGSFWSAIEHASCLISGGKYGDAKTFLENEHQAALESNNTYGTKNISDKLCEVYARTTDNKFLEHELCQKYSVKVDEDPTIRKYTNAALYDYNSGNLDDAISKLTLAQNLDKNMTDGWKLYLQATQGRYLREAQRYEEAIFKLKEAEGLTSKHGDNGWDFSIFYDLSISEGEVGNYLESRRRSKQALKAARVSSKPWILLKALEHEASIQLGELQYVQACPLLEEAYSIVKKQRYYNRYYWNALGLSSCHIQQGRPKKALEILDDYNNIPNLNDQGNLQSILLSGMVFNHTGQVKAFDAAMRELVDREIPEQQEDEFLGAIFSFLDVNYFDANPEVKRPLTKMLCDIARKRQDDIPVNAICLIFSNEDVGQLEYNDRVDGLLEKLANSDHYKNSPFSETLECMFTFRSKTEPTVSDIRRCSLKIEGILDTYGLKKSASDLERARTEFENHSLYSNQ